MQSGESILTDSQHNKFPNVNKIIVVLAVISISSIWPSLSLSKYLTWKPITGNQGDQNCSQTTEELFNKVCRLLPLSIQTPTA